MSKPDQPEPTPNHLPADSSGLFPEFKFKTIDVDTHQGVIIERILENGSWEQLRWLFSTHGEEVVAQWVSQHGFRLLSRRSFALWRLPLDVDEYQAPAWAAAAKAMLPW